MTPGGTTYETTQLNIESLWTGGPFADPVQCLYCNPYICYIQQSSGIPPIDHGLRYAACIFGSAMIYFLVI